MIYVSFALVVAVIVVAVVLAGVIRSQQRAASRREDALVNQLMHLAGKTWQPPPEWKPQPTAGLTLVDDLEPNARVAAWSSAPEQDPVY